MFQTLRDSFGRASGAMIFGLLLSFATLSVASADKLAFHIDAQDASTALTEFGRQSQTQILFAYELVKGLKTQAVIGDYEPTDAIRLLLDGTGLQASAGTGGVLVVERAGAHHAAAVPNGVMQFAEANGTVDPEIPAAGAAKEGKKSLWDRFRLAQNEPASPSDSSSSRDEKPSENSGKNSNQQNLEEIIVTAQKREERLQDVPISIAVLSGSELDKSSTVSVTDALSSVPGIAVNVQGQNGETQITMRGVTAGGGYGNGSSPVGYYIDSVPFGLVSSAIAPDASAYDLERIEVLRGPQGTLYGAGGENGLVRLLTKEANLSEFELKTRLSDSSTEYGGNNYRGDLAVNVPIIDGKLAARVVLGDEHLSGWLNLAGQRHANDADLRNYRLKVNAQPTNDLSIAFSVWRTDDKYGGPTWADDNRNGSDGNPLYPVIGPSPITTKFTAYGLKLGYEYSAFSVTSSSSYLDYHNFALLDLRAESIPDSAITTWDAHVFSQEIVLNSKNEGQWLWSGGLFYRDAKDANFLTVIPQIPNLINLTDSSRSAAVFGQIGQKFFHDILEWSLGLRYFTDQVKSHDYIYLSHTKNNFNATTPRAVLTWLPSNDLTVYASYSQGFRSGFPQSASVLSVVPTFPSVKPDKLNNYEVGAKGNLLDSKLSFDAAVYYIDWRDVQQQLTVHPPQSAVSTLLLGAGVNGSSASGVGADLGITLRPIEQLELGANFSWNNLRQDSDIISNNSVLFHKGDRLNFSPEYTVRASLQYSLSLGSSGLEGKLRAEANYTSPQDSRILLNGESLPDTGNSILVSRASFSLVSGARWTATLFADNINNWQGVVLKQFGTNPIYYSRVRPRTAGLQLEYNFR